MTGYGEQRLHELAYTVGKLRVILDSPFIADTDKVIRALETLRDLADQLDTEADQEAGS